MPRQSFYLLDSWGTLRTDTPEEWLGRVVTNFENPKDNYAPENAQFIRGNTVENDPGYTNVSELLSLKKESSIYSALADLLRFSVDDSRSTAPSIKAPKVQKLLIGQHPEVFQRLQEDPAAKAAVDKLRWNRRTAYLIVGLLVTDQLAFTESSSSLSSTSLRAKLPTKEIAAAAGAPGVDIPVEVGRDENQEKGREGGAELQGRRIFAIQYRILRKHRNVPLFRRGTELSEESLKGDRTFGDNVSASTEEVALDMVLEEDISLEDEIDSVDERIFDL